MHVRVGFQRADVVLFAVRADPLFFVDVAFTTFGEARPGEAPVDLLDRDEQALQLTVDQHLGVRRARRRHLTVAKQAIAEAIAQITSRGSWNGS